MLAALQIRFAQALGDRSNGRGYLPQRFRETYADACQLSNLKMQAFGIGQGIRLDVNPVLGRLASEISHELLAQVLVWAPPVVAPGQGKHPPFVVANQVTFALHRYVYPGKCVSARMLDYRPGWQLSATDVAEGAVQAFYLLVESHRSLIVRACRTGREASALSGLGTTRCGEIRQQLGLLTL